MHGNTLNPHLVESCTAFSNRNTVRCFCSSNESLLICAASRRFIPVVDREKPSGCGGTGSIEYDLSRWPTSAKYPISIRSFCLFFAFHVSWYSLFLVCLVKSFFLTKKCCRWEQGPTLRDLISIFPAIQVQGLAGLGDEATKQQHFTVTV